MNLFLISSCNKKKSWTVLEYTYETEYIWTYFNKVKNNFWECHVKITIMTITTLQLLLQLELCEPMLVYFLRFYLFIFKERVLMSAHKEGQGEGSGEKNLN